MIVINNQWLFLKERMICFQLKEVNDSAQSTEESSNGVQTVSVLLYQHLVLLVSHLDLLTWLRLLLSHHSECAHPTRD